MGIAILKERSAINFVYDIVDFEAIRDRILFELKLGRQASGYKAKHKHYYRAKKFSKLLQAKHSAIFS